MAPRTPVEELLAGIWADVLRIDRVGVDDDFLALGGHSLLGARVLARLRAALGVELPLRALFEAPTVARLAKRIEAARQVGAWPAAPPLTRAPRDAELPLSFAQQRLWFLDQLDRDSATYTIRAPMRLEGAIEARAVEQSLAEIVRRHEALRTTFVAVGGEPHQVIATEPSFTMPVVDLTSLPELTREAEARRLAAEDARRPFDLSRRPLFRATLVRLGERAHLLLMTMHHVVSDGWSVGVLQRELAALYGAYAAGRPSPLPELAVQVADVALWQRAWLSGEVLAAQLAYWTEQLRGAPAALELPTDRPRPVAQSYQGATHSFTLPRTLSAALAALSRGEGVTLFMTLLAAFQVLLYRYSGQDDVVVGTAIAGRTRVETEGLIGLFVNTLVLRTNLGGEPTFRELLARVRQVTLGAFAHQDVPFEKLVEELAPTRDLGRSPLFQAMLVLQDTSGRPRTLGGATVSPMVVETATAKFDLTLSVEETGRGIEGALEYATDLFDAATIARMAGHFEALLEGIVEEPGARIHEIGLLSEEERRALAAWNATTTGYPRDASIQVVFEAQVDATPDAVAVSFGEEELTYRELDRRGNQLARYLQRKGVRAETPVGLALPRSLEMVVAIVAVLKAGGAYVPLDLEHPPARLAWMLEDAHVPVVVALGTALPWIPPGIAVIRLDLEGDAIAREDDVRLDAEASGESLACVMYTSGSTGKPKGVCVIHRGVVRLVKQTSYARFAVDEVFLQLAPVAFDASTFEIWGALLNGGRLVLFPGDKPSVAELGDIIARSGVTTLWLTAGLFNAVIDADPRALASLRQLLVGGEALSAPHVQRALAELPGVTLINGYGPTEGTTFTCCFTVTGTHGLASIPIGRPIADTVAHVLDAYLSPVPVGVPGELYVGGDGLARGYLNRPELTAERFVRDPFSADPAARLYRTGDRVRRLPDGTLDFLGRIDEQVKIRGYRIEPGEIEAALSAHPQVRSCVVIPREDTPGDKRLCAYVVLDGDGVSASALREHLAATLPDYMVPAAFVVLEALPLTPNGKLDRAALPAPEGRKEREHRGVAPRTPTEEVLAGIWADVLRLDHVDVEDDFFALGGHSLLGTRLISRIRAAFGVELPLRALFEAPTVARLAGRVEAAREQGARPAAPPLVPMPRQRALPLSYAQQRLWLIDQLEPSSATYNIPLALRLDGALDAGALTRSLAEIVRRHEALRTNYPTVKGEPHQVIAAAVPWSLLVVDLASLPDAAREGEAQRLATEDANRPFDLARGPLLRATLLRLDERAHVLLLNMHHVVSDGWSIGVLTTELSALYEAFSAGRPSPLPELRIQYADYALWQREWLSGEVLAEQLAYWKEHLRGAPAALDLPLDRPRPAVESHRGAVLPILLPRELSAALGALSRREGATLFMTLLAAFQILLHRHSGQQDVVVGSPIAGRTLVETEGLIGFFVSTLVLRGRLGGDPTFRELLAQVREVTLGAYAHQDVPFEKLVEELAPPRDLGRAPLFQAMLILQNASASPPSLGGVSLSRLAVERTTAKFDLTLSLGETAEGLCGSLEYATDLFDAATMARMAGHLQVLLEGAVADPGAHVSELPMLTEPERRQLLVEWNDTAADFPREATLHALFEAQAERTPGATALIFEKRSLGYRELDARANRLAHRLIALGAGPGTLVGLALERSPEMVVGLLGILKAGAAYVPLDPTYPRDRLAFMIEDAGLGLLVSEGSLAGALPEHGARLVLVDEPARDAPDTSPGRRARAEDVAYVIYTSGSTGRPKGVEIPHRAVVNFLAAMQVRPGLTAADRLLAVTSLSFDIAVLELFLPLVVGAQVDIVARATAMDGAALRSRIEQAGITVMQATPSTWRLLLDAGWPGGQGFVALVGGEAVPRDLVNALAARAGSVWNMYGPTETTIWSCIHPLTASEGPVLIGRPIANTRALVLDRRLSPLPIGVPGELYLGGAGLARGYLGRPELTRERFIDDPFIVGERLYGTGDLCRFRSDGTLECLGRLDHQVKLRGHRIELGEIEAVLAEHPAVRQAVATVREDTPGDKRLIAYLVAAFPASKPAADDLRRHLQTRLPDYMIPATFVTLDAIPLTPNGKIDRRSLPAPAALPREGGSFAAPRTLTERVLAGIWADLLGLDRVGIDEDFFALGGHSMLAVRVFGRIQERFGKSLPIATLFQAPTIEKLADLLARDDWAPSWSSLIPISTTGSRRPFFCVHAFGGNVLNFRLVSRYLGEDQPFYGLQSRGLGGGEAPHERIEEMAAAYIDEMRAVQPRGPYAIGGSSSGGVIAYEMAQQLLARGERVAALVLLDTKRIGPPSARTTRVFAASSLRRFAARLDHHLGNLLIRPPREGLAYLAERVGGRLGRNPTAETVKTGGPAIRRVIEANRAALRSYTPRPYPGQVVMLLCEDEPDRATYDWRLAWADLVEGLVVRYIPGSHENMLDEPQVSEVAAVLTRCLENGG